MNRFLLFGLSCCMGLSALAASFPLSDVIKSGDTASWSLRGGSVGTGPFGEKVINITKEDTQGISVLSYTGFIKPGERKQLDLTYRSNLANSSKDRGAWIIVVWFDPYGKDVKNEFFILKESANWIECTIRLSPSPEKANRVNIQIRVQQRIGTLALKSVQLSDLSPETEKKEVVQDDVNYLKSLEKVAEYELVQLPGRKPDLKSSSGDIQADYSKNNGLPASFRLPDRFCENPDLVYVVQVKFHYTQEPGEKTVGIFQLGRNMHGQRPNSLCLNIWNGKRYFARMTGNIPGAVSQVCRLDFRISPRETVSSTLVTSPDKLIHFLNGIKLGETKGKAPFVWMKNQLFWIGAEDQGLSEFPGTIESFKLGIYKRPFELKQNSSAYFYGKGVHEIELDLSGKIPASEKVEAALSDVHGKTLPVVLKPEISNGKMIFTLPSELKFGYYELNLKIGDYQFNHAYVIVPEKAKRIAGLASPFAGCQEISVSFEKQTKEEIGKLMKFLADAGMSHFRFWLSWDSIQNKDRKYDFSGLDRIVDEAGKNGINLYPIFTGGRFDYQTGIKPGKFVQEGHYPPLEAWKKHLQTVAKRYQGRVNEYQIWNEPETPGYFLPFEPKPYVDLLKISYETLKGVDPKITVGLGGFCAALNGDVRNRKTHKPTDNAWGAAAFYALNPQPYYDIVDIHRYASGFAGQSWDWHYADMKEMKKYLATVGESKKPIWNSETGFVTGTPGRPGGWGVGNVISMEDHAARAVQWYVQSLASGISRNYWYSVVRDECGLARADYSPYPAFAAYVNMVNRLSGSVFKQEFDLGHNIRAYQFKAANGKYYVYAWTNSGTELLTFRSKAPVENFDLWGNLLNRDCKVGQIGTVPMLFASSSPMNPERMVELVAQGVYAKGTPVTLEFVLLNPVGKASEVELHLAGDGKALAMKKVSIAPDSSQRITLRIPETPAKLEIGVKYTGGLVYSTIMEISLHPRSAIDLQGGKEFKGKIDRVEQVHIGKEIRDDQNRIVSKCLWMGKDDLSAELALFAANGKIHFAVNVKDNTVVPAPKESRALYAYDSVEMFLDQNLGGQAERIQVVMAADGRVEFYSKHKLSGFTHKAVRTPTGYRISGSFDIPAKKPFGIDFTVNDCDSVKTPRKAAMAYVGDDQNFASSGKYAIVLTD